VSPTLLRGLLVALAIVLGVAGAWLAATGIRPRLVRWRRRRLSRLELALAELDDAVRVEDEGRRRRVLDQLATRLGEADEGALEERSRRLAWSRVPPPEEELVALGDQVRAGLDGGGR
jgi:hypothetical protein